MRFKRAGPVLTGAGRFGAARGTSIYILKADLDLEYGRYAANTKDGNTRCLGRFGEATRSVSHAIFKSVDQKLTNDPYTPRCRLPGFDPYTRVHLDVRSL